MTVEKRPDITAPDRDSVQEKALLDELRAQRTALERQNEALREARTEAETALENYAKLFDFAPIAYFTLDCPDLIRQANFRGAALLACERSKLAGQSFADFVGEAYKLQFAHLMERVFRGSSGECCEILLSIKGEERWVAMEARLAASKRSCLAAVSDITERKYM